ncbi:MAG: M23 family metallopeptidase [Firmicutes bacterium]|nr:M23 family metallopeptidase [Bacillota bacterium]
MRKWKGCFLIFTLFCVSVGAVPLGAQMTDPTRVFPLSKTARYSYEPGFGDGRSFGGERFHEGVDIIAPKGTPVRSVCNGVVTNKGWLTLGGYRIGVTDAFGVYHYYAHLSAYADVEIGDTVSAGQVLGYVGSTGYGPEGTDDQMVPHLHFGLYMNDAAVDPYQYLRQWDGK